MLIRQFARREQDLRETSFVPHVSRSADGSCVVKMGHTHVLCAALLEKGLSGIVVEFGILPTATHPRTPRQPVSFQAQEIQEAIQQNLNLALDLEIFQDIGLRIDCDVLQAEGSLRSAAISGAYVALALALKKISHLNLFPRSPLIRQIASLSCGIIKGKLIVDLDQEEMDQADVIGDFVFNDDGQLLNLYLKGQRFAIPMSQVTKMADATLSSVRSIFDMQKKAIHTSFHT